MPYTTTKLLSAIQRKSFAPAGQTTFTNADILSIADECVQTAILPSIISLREEFFVFDVDFTISEGTAAYAIPARAVGMTVREVSIIDASGNIKDLGRIEPERVRTTGKGTPNHFYLKNNSVVLYPKPNSSGDTLRMQILLAPGEFIQTSAAAVISAIDTGANTVTVSSIPNSWTTGDSFDLIKKDGAHEYRAIDQASVLVSGTDITFSSLPSDLAVGDYVAPAGYSPLVQLPPNYRPILAQLVAAEILLSQGQPGGADAAKRAEQMLESAEELISPRVKGEDRVLLPSWHT